MKRYIKSNEFVFPEEIEIERYPGKYIVYHKQYEHAGGGCYYKNDDPNDWCFGNSISLYPDGHLTYLFKGRERDYDVNWRYIDNENQ